MAPSYLHSYIQARLSSLLNNDDRFSIFCALTIDINGKDYNPDISVYKKRKINRFNDIIKMSEMPLLAIEILSPTQGTQEIMDKFKIYFEAGIQSCWLVEPVAGAAIVFSSPFDSTTFIEGNVVDEIIDLKIPVKPIFD